MNTTVIIVNFKTKYLIKKCLETFRAFYKDVPVILIDNGSGDDSTEWCKKQENEYTRVILHGANIRHGPALHEAALPACPE